MNIPLPIDLPPGYTFKDGFLYIYGIKTPYVSYSLLAYKFVLDRLAGFNADDIDFLRDVLSIDPMLISFPGQTVTITTGTGTIGVPNYTINMPNYNINLDQDVIRYTLSNTTLT